MLSFYYFHALMNMDQDNISDDQFRWEYLKYEIRKNTIQFLINSLLTINRKK